MHALNTNEEMKMKKISYFGKEYTVSNDVKWVATDIAGYIETFNQKPSTSGLGWVYSDGLLDKIPAGAIDWQNSLRKVEDILVKGNRLKIGDKVMVNKDACGFKKGQIVEVYKLCRDGVYLFKGDNLKFKHCDGEDGAYLLDCSYDIIEETPTPSGHPHADLTLKYAMIAQYDAEPWKHFEYETSTGWTPCLSMAAFNENANYRLKPQEPVVQVGQVWVSEEGTNVIVDTPSDINTIYFKYHLGGLLIKNSVSLTHFIKHFKRKD